LDTIVAFRRRFPGAEFFFIIGSDNIREMLSWRNYTTIIRQVTLCVVHRPGYSLRVPYELADAAIVRAPSPEWGISSTLVRSLRAGNSTCRYLVPDPVLEYMDRYGLYQDAP
jgi:nicotinate-nucleotide adenylyltransferase